MLDLSPDLEDRLALALIPGLGPKTTAALVRHFGSPGAVRRATAAQLRQVPRVGEALSEKFADALRGLSLERERTLMAQHNTAIVAIDLPGYPAALQPLADAPPLLYRRGEYQTTDERAIAIVGSRECTAYGLKVAERFARDFAARGWTVVSGLARGIDGAAHRAALDAGGRTVAVLAGGLSRIYPPEHLAMSREVEQRGCLFSEAAMGQSPQPGMFPQRNRIISGLSRAVIIVEAGERSGALSTAHRAAEQGRDVFAVPGNVDSLASAGCLHLLRQGAKLARHADDVFEDLAGIAPPTGDLFGRSPQPARTADLFASPPVVAEPVAAVVAPNLQGVELQIWDGLASGPLHADVLAERAGLEISGLSRALTMLELKRLVKRLPGGVVERTAR